LSGSPVILEVFTRLAPLGLRFRDPVTGAPVGGGLSVAAYSPQSPWKRIQGFANSSGVYVFHRLPGLEGVSWADGDAEFWQAPPATMPFIIEVSDPRNHFLPCTFEVRAPARDVYVWQPPPGSPVEPAGMVPLFSSSDRPVPAGMAVIRADLREEGGTPAAGALLEACLDGKTLGRGLADERGRVALFFPYPQVPDFASGPDEESGSLPAPPPVPLTEQTWQLELRACYRWDESVPAPADLSRLLAQAPARLWANLSPAVPLASQTLCFGRELVVRSELKSFLYISQP
jgi:hypothetical protein